MLEFKLIYGSDGYNAAKNIREAVFMEEQGFSYDKDEHDGEAWHIVGYEKGKLIAAARIYKEDEGIFSLGRVCVDKEYRGMYIGDTLLRALEDKAVALKGYKIKVSAQEDAVGFYEKEGYEKTGEAYPEDGKTHIPLEKDLTKPFKRCACCGSAE